MNPNNIILIHEELINRSKRFIEFIKTVPTNKTIGLYYNSLYTKEKNYHHCIVKVIGFNKESIKVKVIALEKRSSDFYRLLRDYKNNPDATYTIIKIQMIKDFTWTLITTEDLPLYINYEFKSNIYEAALKGYHPL